MKKLSLGILIVITVLALSGIVTATPWDKGGEMSSEQVNEAASANANEKAVFMRYEAPGAGFLKSVLKVRHEFPNGFTANVTDLQLSLLNSLGIETEEVQLYYVLGPPDKCGDGTCQGFESPETCPEDCGGGECYPDNQYPWGIVKVNGGSGGSGMTVAVLDTGVDQDHPDLVGNTISCVTFGYTTCEDGHGHGTHVSGTVLANGKIVGVAPGASLMAVKICSDSGGCWGDDIAAGIYYAANGKDGVPGTGDEANIISMSIGGDYPDSTIKGAIDYAVSKGVLLVAAAGNDGPNEGSIDYPGAYAEVMAIGAIDSNENVPDWSSRGINDGDDSVISEREVELGAPGVSVESSYNDGCYTYKSGTSMATPHVSGLAAKLWQGTASETRACLRTIAKDIYPTGYDIATGYGLPIAPACSSNEDCATGEICCSGQCIVPTCSNGGSCDDGNACTIDTCNYPGTCGASCSNVWPTCDLLISDGCCGPGCTSETDVDCLAEDPCLNCFKGVCDGKCHRVREDATCPDCW